MTKWDEIYLELCKKILEEGVEVENRTGINTIKIPNAHFLLDLSEEFPILESKQLYIRQAVLEMMWIYQVQSNDVKWLQDRGVHIWDEWQADENGDYVDNDGTVRQLGKEYAGTIGSAYGYIVDKFKLIDERRDKFINDPNDRRGIMSLWQNAELPTAVLPSCVFLSMWDVTDGKLSANVIQRSCDVPLGLPFNVTQYAVLLSMLAREAGLLPWQLDWTIKDAHIYVNQIDGIKEQLKRKDVYDNYKNLSKRELLLLRKQVELLKDDDRVHEEIKNENLLRIIDVAMQPGKPELWLNPEVTNFYDYDNSKECRDVKVKNYKHMGKIDFPLAR